ncbi:MAG: FAD-dependent oxidoreductase [Saprospiraceae bacterium]
MSVEKSTNSISKMYCYNNNNTFCFFNINLPILSFIFSLFLFSSCEKKEAIKFYDVIVVGEGTGATSAAIQSARSGAKTLWINNLAWEGGMLTAAGVSATDGNHKLPAGLWGEFRTLIWDHYGGADSVFTGWVSNTMFEPKIGKKYWEQLIRKEENLEVLYSKKILDIQKGKESGNWHITIQNNQGELEGLHTSSGKKNDLKKYTGKILVDGSDLGNFAALVGAEFDVGMDAKNKTDEAIAPEKSNNIIQDLTYAAILKDFGKENNNILTKPKNYSPEQFYCCCKNPKCDDKNVTLSCDKMLDYGKLPNGKFMINWPKSGNDFYSDLMTQSSKKKIAYDAKQKTLQFIYFLQTELGFTNLGLATDEFPTKDHLPLYPYHREGRRIHGEVQLNVNHILKPYDYNLYRTGIAVGDYPIDHHHAENPDAPEIDFPKVPSFNIPIGSLIPKNVDDLVVADKAISVTNIVNGSSRLQPVIIQIGQAAGLIAAVAANKKLSPNKLIIRDLQDFVLEYKGYLLPFIDVPAEDVHFETIQKIGATGILRGKGIPYQWANQTWFYPDTFINVNTLLENINDFESNLNFQIEADQLDIENAIQLVFDLDKKLNINRIKVVQSIFFQQIAKQWSSDFELNNFDKKRWITKREFAVLLDKIIDPFHSKAINFKGQFK